MFNIEDIPLYSIFILLLILSGGYATELIPCRLKYVLSKSIFLRHFICFLTLIFFVSLLEIENKDKKIYQIILRSFLLYIFFIFLIKTQYQFFIAILILLAIIYLLKLKNDEILNDKEKDIKLYNTLLKIRDMLKIIVLILIFIGFIVYLGQKKYEYKNKFSYVVFLFGALKCKNTFDKDISISQSLKYILN